MTDQPFLASAVILFGAALAVGWLFRVLRAPNIIGFLFAGIVIGPAGMQWIARENVQQFADVGLVLLLFVIGLELTPESLTRIGARLVVATVVQVAATIGLTIVILTTVDSLPLLAAALLGLAVSNCSTPIVLKQLSDRGEVDTAAGVITTGILLLQDIAVILVMLFLPLAAVGGETTWNVVAGRTALAIVGLGILTVGLRFALPVVLNQLLRHRGRELLTLFAMVMACAGAWLTTLAGWSGALGACIAGLLLSVTDVRHQLIAEITPFRNVFNALFFISLGMLVNPDIAITYAAPIALAAIATLLLKPVLTAAAIYVAGWPIRIALHAGIGLCTVSEFGYVLSYEADRLGLLPDRALEVLIAYAVGTMVIGAMLVPAAGPLANSMVTLFAGWRATPATEEPSSAPRVAPAGHVLVVGYGVNGHNLAQVLRATRIEHCVIEMNPSLARQARQAGANVIVGDAAQLSILERAGIGAARAAVVAISDVPATRHIVAQARALRPDVYILARTRYVSEIEPLFRAGANEVIPEEFETSIEIFSHVLREFRIPDNVVEAQVAMIRAGHYGMLRGRPMGRAARHDLLRLLEVTATQTYLLEPASPACGRTIREVNLRAQTGVTIIAVVREGKPYAAPSPDFRLQEQDVLVLVGAHKQLDAAEARLAPQVSPGSEDPATTETDAEGGAA